MLSQKAYILYLCSILFESDCVFDFYIGECKKKLKWTGWKDLLAKVFAAFGAPEPHWVKRWPTDLAVSGLIPI